MQFSTHLKEWVPHTAGRVPMATHLIEILSCRHDPQLILDCVKLTISTKCPKDFFLGVVEVRGQLP